MEPHTIITHETLHKRGVKGEVRVWRMELGQFADEISGHRVVSGILGGVETPSGWTVAEPKNVGKKNATTSTSQAISEIQNNYAIKRERGYFDDVAKIDEVPFVKPMLAQDWDKRKAKVDVTAGVYAQPKLDGIRCIARADGLWTRTGKPITAVPHIAEALEHLFVEDPDLILDGELYNHELKEDFNTITSIVRKVKPTEGEVAQARELIQYHIYDMPSHPGGFFARNECLVGTLERFDVPEVLRRVETVYVDTLPHLDELYSEWMAEGYEGQMIRLDTTYEFKRSNNLCKRKEFQSDEFPVVAIEEGKGNWSGCVKRFIVRLPDGSTNDATPRGTQTDLRMLLEDGITPAWATVRYFGYTPDGKLRFPIATDWGYSARSD